MMVKVVMAKVGAATRQVLLKLRPIFILPSYLLCSSITHCFIYLHTLHRDFFSPPHKCRATCTIICTIATIIYMSSRWINIIEVLLDLFLFY